LFAGEEEPERNERKTMKDEENSNKKRKGNQKDPLSS
jgi:hypothetical protein